MTEQRTSHPQPFLDQRPCVQEWSVKKSDGKTKFEEKKGNTVEG